MNVCFRLGVVLVLISLTGVVKAADKVPYTELVVKQFVLPNPDMTWHPDTPKGFINAAISSCTASTGPTSSSPPAAPLVAALGGIFIDWIFTRSMKRISEKLKERIETYSEGYSNRPQFADIIASDSSKWDSSNESCVVFQRIECSAGTEDVKSNTASCDQSGKVGLSVGLKLRNENNFIRVVPFASELSGVKPQHDGGKVAVAVTAHMEAIGWNEDNAGMLWKSAEMKLISASCEVSKASKASPNLIYEKACLSKYIIDDTAWKRSQIIPMPPKTAQAFVFTVGEVGQPSKGLKGFAEFMDATGESMSAALSEAFQKKIKLKE